MSKERFEELAYNVGISLDGEKAIMSSDDYDFLYNYALQQAERVEKLEEDNKNLQVLSNINRKEHMRIHEQNKRYKQALEEIIRQHELEDEIDDYDFMWNVKQIARKALEGEE